MKLKRKKQRNFLDFVPVKNDKYRWVELENGIVQIQIDRNSLLERAVRFFFKTPKMMKIDLDAYGSFIWKQIDGEKDMHAIAEHLDKNYGQSVHPLYERLGQYMTILKNNHFIHVIPNSQGGQ